MHIFFFFNDTATTEIYTLSLHDALPISPFWAPASARKATRWSRSRARRPGTGCGAPEISCPNPAVSIFDRYLDGERSEEHTSELQSRQYLVCRLLLEKKNKHQNRLTLYL